MNNLKKLYPEEYKILRHKWGSMITRCTNPNNRNYVNYGGRGITVCDKWRKFSNFFEWSLDNGFHLGLTIDRIDTNKGYEPNNCRYITNEEQQRNRRDNRCFIDPFDNEQLCLAAIARKYNIPEDTFRKRIDKYNMPLEKALTKPFRENTRWHILVDPIDGEQLCLTDLARKHGMSPLTLDLRLRKEWNLEEAITKPINKRVTRKNVTV